MEVRSCKRHGLVEFGNYRAGGGICGYNRSVSSLHFHHVDPTTKSFAVNMAHGKSLAAFKAEARKCVLVCANCHGEIEAGLTQSPPAMAKYGEDWTAVEAVEAPPMEDARPRDEHPRLFP